MFVSNRTGKGNLWILNLRTNELRRITNFPGKWGLQTVGEPRWSRDGTKIAFSGSKSAKYSWEVYLVNDDGSGLRQVTSYPGSANEAHSACWSPTNRDWLYYLKIWPGEEAAVHRTNLETGEDMEIPNWGPGSASANAGYTHSFGISNNEKWVLFSREPNGGDKKSTYSGYQDMSGNLVKLLLGSGDLQAEYMGRINRADGWILYHQYAGAKAPANIFKMKQSGKVFTQLTFGVGDEAYLWPTWTRGGNDGYIIFDGNRTGNRDLFLMKADPSAFPDGMVNLTHNPHSDRDPDWTSHE